MKNIVEFLKTTTLGGLVVLVPLAIVGYFLSVIVLEAHRLTKAFAESIPDAILDLLPSDALTHPAVLTSLAVTQVVLLCFFAGLAVRTRLGRGLGKWAKENIARRIPMYEMLGNLTKSLAGMDVEQFRTVEVDLYGSEGRVLGFLAEELPDGRCTVFVPSSPVPTMGQICVVPRTSVRVLPVKLTDTVNAISQWGVESTLLYREGEASAEAGDAS